MNQQRTWRNCCRVSLSVSQSRGDVYWPPQIASLHASPRRSVLHALYSEPLACLPMRSYAVVIDSFQANPTLNQTHTKIVEPLNNDTTRRHMLCFCFYPHATKRAHVLIQYNTITKSTKKKPPWKTTHTHTWWSPSQKSTYINQYYHPTKKNCF